MEASLTTPSACFRQLSAFRFNWQRQWTHTCEENVRRDSGYQAPSRGLNCFACLPRQVTSLCWRPDGKLIVAGLAGACILATR